MYTLTWFINLLSEVHVAAISWPKIVMGLHVAERGEEFCNVHYTNVNTSHYREVNYGTSQIL